MDDEMIERCAKACFEKLCPGIRYTEQDKEFYKEAQLAAIKAMREPTDGMLGAIHGCYPDIPDKYASEAAKIKWYAAIDAIISDK